MYDYGYSYGYGLVGGNTYNPLINYDWSTTTSQEYKTDGVELVTNGGFDTDSDWTKNAGSVIANGRLDYDGVNNTVLVYQNTLVVGQYVVVTYTISNYVSGSFAVLRGGISKLGDGAFRNSNGTYQDYGYVEGNKLYLKGDSNFIGSIDNISVQKVIQEPNKRYLKDVGSTPTYNASMYFGRGAYLNGVDQSIEHDAISSSDIVAYSFCGKQTFTSNRYNLWTTVDGISYYLVLNTEYKNISYIFNSNYNYVLNLTKNSIKLYENGLLVINITTTDILYGSAKTIGRRGSSYYGASYLKDFYIFDRNLTQSEITQAYEQPEVFYAMAQADSTCVLNMPMCETSSTVRNYKTGIDYQITNYTTSVRDNAKNLQYGLQTCKFVRDGLGVIQSASDYLEGDTVGYADTGWVLQRSVGSFSIEFIQKHSNNGIFHISGRNESVTQRFYFGENGAGRSVVRYLNANQAYSDTASVSVGHTVISFDFDTNEMLVYFRGAYIGSYALTSFVDFSKSIILGAEGGSTVEKLGEAIRLFKVHQKVLTQAEITANYNSYRAKGLLS